MNRLPDCIMEKINASDLTLVLSKPSCECDYSDMRLIEATADYIGQMMIVLQRDNITNKDS